MTANAQVDSTVEATRQKWNEKGTSNVQAYGRDLMTTATAPGQPQGKVEQASTSYIIVE